MRVLNFLTSFLVPSYNGTMKECSHWKDSPLLKQSNSVLSPSAPIKLIDPCLHSINKNLEWLPLLTTSSQTASVLELGPHSSKTQGLSFTKVKNRARGHIN